MLAAQNLQMICQLQINGIRFVFVCQALRQRFCRARGGIPKEFSVCKKAADLPNRVLSGIGGLTDDSSAAFDKSISVLYDLVKRFGKGFSVRKP